MHRQKRVDSASGMIVEGPSLSGFDSAIDSDDGPDGDDDGPTLADRHRRMMDAIVEYQGAQGLRNILRLTYSLDSDSDQAIVVDPSTGRSTSINVSDDYSSESTVPDFKRNLEFDAATIDAEVLGATVGPMESAVRTYAPEAEVETVTIERPDPGEPVLITGKIDGGDDITRDFEVQARPDGTVAEFFDIFGQLFECSLAASVEGIDGAQKSVHGDVKIPGFGQTVLLDDVQDLLDPVVGLRVEVGRLHDDLHCLHSQCKPAWNKSTP